MASLFLFGLRAAPAGAQIRFLPAQKAWVIQCGEATYAVGVNERGELQSIYWGAKIVNNSDFTPAHSRPAVASFDLSTTTTPQEYPAWGAGLYTEPALKATYADGNRDVVLHYAGQQISGDTLEVDLKDIAAALEVQLYYRVFPDTGVLERWSRILNKTNQPITLESAQSASWTLPQGDGYGWHYLTGHWGGEWQYHSQPIQTGLQVIESRRGSTSHQANPWFAVDRPGETTEESGPVWFGALGWSGSWRISVEESAMRQVRVIGGFNPFDFGYRLAPGEMLETPPFYAGFTSGGTGEASRILHRFERASILPGGVNARLRPVLYNSWEATEFNVNEAGQIALAEKAAKLGVQRFVIDDGWFGQRKNDTAGLGDWYVNPEKFPHGLKPVIDRVHALGMDFGIWVEPEMVNPDSDLYRKHPDWAMNFPGRPQTEGRNQLVLNLAREDVTEYVFQWLDRLVSHNDIAFLKWDYNRNWAEPGWDAVPVQDQKKIWVTYVRNLYDIMDRLRAKHPKLEIESCSGGGGRVDLGILRRTDEVWPSDNTDALDRLTLQDGFTRAYTPGIMMAWVTDVPNYLDKRVIPLKFRFLVAMTGSLGLGGNLNKWTPEEMQEGGKLVAYYKTIASTVQRGEQYRLITPEQSEQSAENFVSQDGSQAVLFAFLHSEQFGASFPTIRLRGLDANATYAIHPLDPETYQGLQQASGDYLMHHGINLNLQGDYAGASVVFEKIKEVATSVMQSSSSSSTAPSSQAIEFADQPNFTIAGVTDWTAAGGHGSDSSLRASEALTRETLTLKPEGPAYSATSFPGNADADSHRLSGALDEKRGDPLAAVREYRQAVRLDPSEQNYFDWGSELLLHRAVWQAQEVFRQGAEANPKSARMLMALGTALFAGGRDDEAARRVCAASDLNPKDPAPYIFLGKIERAAPLPLDCVEPKLARFVEEQPENALANYFYAMAIWKRRERGQDQRASQQAESLLTKAVTIDPKCADAYLQLGVLYFAQSNIPKAIAFYKKAIEADPQLSEAYYRLGVAYDRIGESAKAKENFQLHQEIEKRQAGRYRTPAAGSEAVLSGPQEPAIG